MAQQSKTEPCDRCHLVKSHYRTAFVEGIYYKRICDDCIGDPVDDINSTAAGYDRRRGYEDNAQDTIQPYNANGPNSEFLRLYPEAAKKVFNKDTIDKLKRKI